MAGQSSEELSMNDILSSIKKFVAGEEKKPEPVEQEERPQTADDSGVVRLAPVFPLPPTTVGQNRATEDKIQALKDLDMPDFIRKAQAERQRDVALDQQEDDLQEGNAAHESPFLPSEQNKITKEDQDSVPSPEDSSTRTMKAYLETIRTLAKEQSAADHKATQRQSLDSFVETTLQAAIHSWLDKNLQSIVETIVQKEVEKLTKTVLQSQEN